MLVSIEELDVILLNFNISMCHHCKMGENTYGTPSTLFIKLKAKNCNEVVRANLDS